MAYTIIKLSSFNDNKPGPDLRSRPAPRLHGVPLVHKSFMRSDFVTIPVTSPLWLTMTAL